VKELKGKEVDKAGVNFMIENFYDLWGEEKCVNENSPNNHFIHNSMY